MDDLCDNADVLAMIVASGGHEAHPVYSGAEALEAIAEFRPDVVILEIGTLDGYELGRQVRRHPRGQDMLLIAITAYGYESDYRQSIAAGFDHHLKTPADPNVVRRLLSTRRPGGGF